MQFHLSDDLSSLKQYKLIYLASPYSKYPFGIDEAAHDIEIITGRLMLRGLHVFSPIAHTHHISRVCNIDPYDYQMWQPADDAIMDVCDALLVVQMTGWEESFGVNYEVDRFRRMGKDDHVHYLYVGTFR